MRVRPALIGGPTLREVLLTAHVNLTRSDMAGTVFQQMSGGVPAMADISGSPALDQAGLARYIWMRFATPMQSPVFFWNTVTPLCSNQCNDAKFQIHAMLTDWDQTTLTWTNQPAVTGSEPALQYRMRRTSALNPGATQSSQMHGVLDCSGKSIVGIMYRATRLTANGLAQLTLSQNRWLSTGGRQSLAVTQRESDGAGTITLTTSTPHNMDFLMPVTISGVGTGYDASYFVQSAPSSTTLVMNGSTAPAEAPVASGGNVLYY